MSSHQHSSFAVVVVFFCQLKQLGICQMPKFEFVGKIKKGGCGGISN